MHPSHQIRLAAAVTALTALAAPGFAQQEAPATLHERYEQRLARRAQHRRSVVEAGLAEARAVGKPVLVLVVPEATFVESDPDLAARSRMLTALLLTSDVDTRCELALLQPVAAKLSELTAIAGTAPRRDLPCALLLDPPAAPRAPDATTAVTPIVIDGRAPDFVVESAAIDTVDRARRERQLTFLAAKEAELRQALTRAIATHGIDRAALARATESRLPAAEHRLVGNWLAGGPAPAPALIVRAAPWVLQAAEARSGPFRSALRAAVATSYSEWILATPPPGGRWPAEPAERFVWTCDLHPTMPPLPGRCLEFHDPL